MYIDLKISDLNFKQALIRFSLCQIISLKMQIQILYSFQNSNKLFIQWLIRDEY